MAKLLNFKEKGKDNYFVYNKKDEFLGNITRSRVGKFMHWVFCPDQQTFFTNGCLKEITMFIRKLYTTDNKKKSKEERNKEVWSENE